MSFVTQCEDSSFFYASSYSLGLLDFSVSHKIQSASLWSTLSCLECTGWKIIHHICEAEGNIFSLIYAANMKDRTLLSPVLFLNACCLLLSLQINLWLGYYWCGMLQQSLEPSFHQGGRGLFGLGLLLGLLFVLLCFPCKTLCN